MKSTFAMLITTADRVITLKYVTKMIATQHNLHATFMPKPIQGLNGSGMHTHISLFNKNGTNTFYDEGNEYCLSSLAQHFIAGLLKNIKEITPILNPTVNSYKRLVPGHEAPTYISWANRNRSALIRIPAEKKNGIRCELRNPDLSGNPYLQFAVMLAAGIEGINTKAELEPPVEKNVYTLTEQQKKRYNIEPLPESLGHSLNIMEQSELLKKILGTHIFENYLHIKLKEWDEYRQQITAWEIEKYFHLI